MPALLMNSLGERGISRVLEKLETAVKNEQYYEAHQMYRTLYFRFLALKKHEDLLKLLYNGSSLLLTKDQQTSGADLAILLIDVLVKSETIPCEEWIDKVVKLFEMISDGIPERDIFLTKSVKWSMGETTKGHRLLHKKIAMIYWKEKKYSLAHKHFLHSCDGSSYASMLIELHTTEEKDSRIDLPITKAVLRLLCLKDIETANETFNNYVQSHPELKCEQKKPPYPLPLLNFIWFTMQLIERNDAKKFQDLCAMYEKHLVVDPNYKRYLVTIGRIWFGIEEIKENRSFSFLDGLFKSLTIEPGEESEPRLETAPAPDLD